MPYQYPNCKNKENKHYKKKACHQVTIAYPEKRSLT